MELKELCEKTLELFGIDTVGRLGEKLWDTCRNNEKEKIRAFADLVGDLSVDWTQKIFQYYEADRKEKMQDYTPKSLAEFCGRLVGEDREIIDMCAGSGALTIQKWKQNQDIHFKLYEFDERVIPYLCFNMMLRNISAEYTILMCCREKLEYSGKNSVLFNRPLSSVIVSPISAVCFPILIPVNRAVPSLIR